MSERYTRKDAERAFDLLRSTLGKKPGHYEDNDGTPPEGSVMVGDGSYRTIPGGWALDWNSTYGGGVIEELLSGRTGVTRPLGSRRRNAREFCDAVHFALNVLREAAK
jgi:hypothetical protein